METCLSLLLRLQVAVARVRTNFAGQAKEMLEKLPPNFYLERVIKMHPIKYQNSMNTVPQQELINIGKAIKGEIVMSTDPEDLSNSPFDNRLPAM